jgi:O-antigen/teichoic acid export membrane protein
VSYNQSTDHQNLADAPIHDGISGESLTQSAVRGFGWNLSGSVVRYGAGFLINVILARLLGPKPFGIVAIATIVISIGNLIVDSGLNASLVQKKELTPNDIKFVFTIQTILGISIYLFIALIAPIIARLFGETDIIPVLRVLSLMIVLQSASQTSIGLLRRNFKFRQIQQAVLVSYLVGYLLLGVPLAFSGKGVWSLVIAQLVQSLIYLIIVYWSAKHPIAFCFRDKNKVTRFGINMLGANIANWIIASLDSVLLGKFFGSEVLGLYNRSMTLAFTPVNIVVSSSQSVIFSASSRSQESISKVRSAFLGVLSTFMIILFPFSITLSLLAEPIISVIYGSDWINAIPFLHVLALALPFSALMAICGPTLAGLGKPEIEFHLKWLIAVIYAIALLIAIQFSLTVILWTVLGMYVLRCVFMSFVTFKVLGISVMNFSKIIIITSISTILVFIVEVILGELLQQRGTLTQLLLKSASAALVWVSVVCVSRKHIQGTDLLALITKVANQMNKSAKDL